MTKVAVLFNEPVSETKKQDPYDPKHNLDFVPVMDVHEATPFEDYEDIVNRLRSLGFGAYSLNLADNFDLLVNNLKTEKLDVIFNFVELFYEEVTYEKNIAGIYELLGIPYTGAPPHALANCQSKILTKKLLKAHKIRIPDFVIIEKPADEYPHNLNYPLIIKPAYEDGSGGIDNDAVVYDHEAFSRRVNYILSDFRQPVLAEEFIAGREFNVSVLGEKDPVVLPISEIDFSEMPPELEKIVSFQAKWDPLHVAYHKTQPVCPADIPAGIAKKIEEIALTCYEIMGVRDYARVDIRINGKNEIFVLEVNPNPDLTEGLGFMRSAEYAGFSYNDILLKIVNFALERGKNLK